MAAHRLPAEVHIADHGTPAVNMPSILKHHLSMAYCGKRDRGYFEAEIYLSPHCGAPLGYGNYTCLQFDVLPGRVFTSRDQSSSIPLPPGFDSHRSPCGQEWIVFDSHQLRPRDIITCIPY